jgi:hypothetical protein
MGWSLKAVLAVRGKNLPVAISDLTKKALKPQVPMAHKV